MKRYFSWKDFLRALLLFCIPFLTACSSLSYLVDAGIGQWKLLNRARPIEDVLKDPNIDKKTLDAIRLIQEAKKFAVAELSLKATSNYNNYVKLDGPYASYVVTASHPLKLEPRRWKFPIVGEIPYIGFFEPQKAETMAKKLREDKEYWYHLGNQDYPPDVNTRGATAYSTLGWLPDPLYSSMISANERRMVETVIHESVHATIFVGSNMDFNERLANFIGLEGSLFYMRQKYGEANTLYIEAETALVSEKIFSAFIDRASTQYRNEIEPFAEKDVPRAFAKKQEFYRSLENIYLTTHKRLKDRWPKLAPQPWKVDFSNWNNAILVGYRTYSADFSIFYSLLEKCSSDIKNLVAWILAEYKTNADPFKENPEAYLQTMAQKPGCMIK